MCSHIVKIQYYLCPYWYVSLSILTTCFPVFSSLLPLLPLFSGDLPHWPCVLVEVCSLDWWDRHRVEGYAHLPLPNSPGTVHLLCIPSLHIMSYMSNTYACACIMYICTCMYMYELTSIRILQVCVCEWCKRRWMWLTCLYMYHMTGCIHTHTLYASLCPVCGRYNCTAKWG